MLRSVSARAAAECSLLLLLICGAACAPGDPQLRIQEERSRWNVQLLSWTQTADHSVALDTRVSGPPNSNLETLTVRFDLIDGDGNVARRVYHSFDLNQVARGGPRDFVVRIPADSEVPELRMSPLLDPAPDEIARIPELAG